MEGKVLCRNIQILHFISVCRGAMDTATQFSENVLKWMDKDSSF